MFIAPNIFTVTAFLYESAATSAFYIIDLISYNYVFSEHTSAKYLEVQLKGNICV